MLGVLACPNLPLTSIANVDKHHPDNQIGCLFSARSGDGAYMQSLKDPSPAKVAFPSCISLLMLCNYFFI